MPGTGLGSVAAAWSIGIGTFALASMAMLGHGTSVSAAEAGHDSEPGLRRVAVAGLSLTACQNSVRLLLSDDVTRVASGRPDLGPVSGNLVASALGGATSHPMERVQRIHDDLVADATSDLLNRFDRDVPLLLDAYRPRIEGACLAAGAS